jgi:hypothetical protein
MNQPFEIETDASQFTIGVVLKQGGHPVAYHSETLAEAKVNYNTYDKEFLQFGAGIEAVVPLYSRKRNHLHTDHHPLDLHQFTE